MSASRWMAATPHEILAFTRERDISADRWTSLDDHLAKLGRDGILDLDQANALERPSLARRLGHLEQLGVATRGDRTWRLSADHRHKLQLLGERGDIIRTMQRALKGAPRELAVMEHASSACGKIVAKGLTDELGDRGYLIIDGIVGRAHYLPLPANASLADWPIGGIVEVEAARDRAADRAIASRADRGIYDVARHQIEMGTRDGGALDREITANVRRLEALRRAQIVERLGEGIWRVPPDLVAQGRAYDQARGANVRLVSRLDLAGQVGALGATWLDHQLISPESAATTTGFGAELRTALAARGDRLVDEGLGQRVGERAHFAGDLVRKLSLRDLADAAGNLARDSGLAYRSTVAGRFQGTLVKSVERSSGRFAMLDDGAGGFALLPWHSTLHGRVGQTISALGRGQNVSWELGRSR